MSVENERDFASWRAAFLASHGRSPTDSDWLTDYNYTWKDRYASRGASTISSASTSRHRFVDDRVADRVRKIRALKTSPNVHEAALATAREAEILVRHGISASDVV